MAPFDVCVVERRHSFVFWFLGSFFFSVFWPKQNLLVGIHACYLASYVCIYIEHIFFKIKRKNRLRLGFSLKMTKLEEKV